MGDHSDNAKSAAVQRQGCMAVRNICARCPDLRPVRILRKQLLHFGFPSHESHLHLLAPVTYYWTCLE
jgi:hypothetical protein